MKQHVRVRTHTQALLESDASTGNEDFSIFAFDLFVSEQDTTGRAFPLVGETENATASYLPLVPLYAFATAYLMEKLINFEIYILSQMTSEPNKC